MLYYIILYYIILYLIHIHIHMIVEGSLEFKLPTIWTDGKAGGKSQGGEEKKWEDQRRERERRKKMQVREKVGKLWFTVFFQWLVALEGRRVGSLKRRVRSHLARWEMKNCTPLWREAHFQVKMHEAHHSRTTFPTTFGSCDVEKVHTLVARSTFPSEKCEKLMGSDRFLTFRCRKSVRCCGAKHISKSKCETHYMFGPLLDVQMSFCVAGARDCAPCEKGAKREGFVAVSTTPTKILHYTTQRPTTLHYTTLHYAPLHYTTHTTLHCTAVHYTTLHYTTLHYTTLHYTTLHYTTLHYTTPHYTPLHSTTLRSSTLHYTTLHYTPLHYATLRYTTLHYITLHSITLHYATLHYSPLHTTPLRYTTNITTTATWTATTTTQLHYNNTTLHSTSLQLQL